MMTVEIVTRNFDCSPALSEHARERFELSTRNFGRLVQKVNVRLQDVNGPRGDDDVHCSVEATLKTGQVVLIEDVHADAYASIDMAAARLKAKLGRIAEKRVDARHTNDTVRN